MDTCSLGGTMSIDRLGACEVDPEPSDERTFHDRHGCTVTLDGVVQ